MCFAPASPVTLYRPGDRHPTPDNTTLSDASHPPLKHSLLVLISRHPPPFPDRFLRVPMRKALPLFPLRKCTCIAERKGVKQWMALGEFLPNLAFFVPRSFTKIILGVHLYSLSPENFCRSIAPVTGGLPDDPYLPFFLSPPCRPLRVGDRDFSPLPPVLLNWFPPCPRYTTGVMADK